MEHINRIEIQGAVGSCNYSIVGGVATLRFSVVTNHIYKDRGVSYVESTWHSVIAFEGEDIKGLDKIIKGDKVNVVGRLKQTRYAGADGVERTSYEVFATKVRKVEDRA